MVFVRTNLKRNAVSLSGLPLDFLSKESSTKVEGGMNMWFVFFSSNAL